jgi:hypothetical protein
MFTAATRFGSPTLPSADLYRPTNPALFDLSRLNFSRTQ